MGKRIISQRRGRSPRHKSLPHRVRSAAKHPLHSNENYSCEIIDIVHCPGHSAPLAMLKHSGNKTSVILAPVGVKIGDKIEVGETAPAQNGNVSSLKNLPEGTIIHNIELRPGDGGKLVRTSGTSARIVTKSETGVVVQMPSKRRKIFKAGCRASVGVVAGGGRKDKPMLKAGKRYHAMKARRKLYPIVSGVSMNAVDHPYGSKGSHTKGRPTQSARNYPPGKKVGKIAPKRTGKKR